ncbi:MAG: Rieske 2Fe-2S domain-containing protein [Deltaproteobacteria bacterium]|nr:Rieske 2Fe-2S domain-containing protein [Deltaproteobacteria bacterium]MBW2047223.1 Rieske 2Fe-2S domain-containing protein [Deltaproteobacteria bacterium]MBW2109965.1 Rieske 2Fe-2S domain-containing protein [Deltaproteobacteria bacterium]MBW2352293.1 Rieske 2Fe-2S domain-containing protein [Deltaproteobacteria bacterium]HDZ91071.1 Rieske (2Fe-2S) protein [Deltaproteobacteria bacterium]
METRTLHRNIFQRLFGICATRKPSHEACWTFEEGKILLDLGRTPELAVPGGAVRLEKNKGLPERVLIVHGDDGAFHAFRNRCSHAGRRLDPVPGMEQVQCCSIGRSTFDHEGTRLSGSAKGPVKTYGVRLEQGRLIVEVQAQGA